VSADPQELLALSRGVRWDFPSSAGKPLRDRADAEPLLARKDGFLAAAAELDVDEATELAANIWRLLVAVEHHNLGHVEIHRGNVDAAEDCFRQVPHSDDPFSEAMSRLNEATVAFLGGDLDRARALLETAETFFAESPMAGVAIDDRFELDWLRDQLR
jgi:hypothetical protein